MKFVARLLSFVLVVLLAASATRSQTIETVAGGLSGDLDPLNTAAGSQAT